MCIHRQLAYFISLSEENLAEIERRDRLKSPDEYSCPSYMKNWLIDQRLISLHVQQKNSYHHILQKVEAFVRSLLMYESAMKSAPRGTQQQRRPRHTTFPDWEDILQDIDSEIPRKDNKQGTETKNDKENSGVRNNGLLQMMERKLAFSKAVLDDTVMKTIKGEIKLVKGSLSLTIYMTLVLHVKYHSLLSSKGKARDSAVILVKHLLSVPSSIRAVLLSHMESELMEYVLPCLRYHAPETWLLVFSHMLDFYDFYHLLKIQRACRSIVNGLGISRSNSIEVNSSEAEEEVEVYFTECCAMQLQMLKPNLAFG